MAEALELGWIGGSLGSVMTLVAHPASTTHRQVDPEARRAAGMRNSQRLRAVKLFAASAASSPDTPASMVKVMGSSVATATMRSRSRSLPSGRRARSRNGSDFEGMRSGRPASSTKGPGTSSSGAPSAPTRINVR